MYLTGATARLTSFVQSRNEWCISRQRAWGVPIPALYDVSTGKAVLTPETVQHIISVLRERGTDAWFDPKVPNEIWIPPTLTGEYRRGTETMDVWFDSGTSWSMLPRQADLYLEGTDQHRGWFQSSLLTSLAVRGFAPYKTVITHGFVLDEDSRKMSKSLGNVTSPMQLMEMWTAVPKKSVVGIDGMRFWIASSSFTVDVSVSQEVLSHVSRNLDKIWITIKFLVGNIGDLTSTEFDYEHLERVCAFEMGSKGSWIGMRCINCPRSTPKSANTTTITTFLKVPPQANTLLIQAVHSILLYTVNYMSGRYFLETKDKLYCDEKSSLPRRASQYVFLQVPPRPTLRSDGRPFKIIYPCFTR
jgi:isoleucyl-tRNA synthetase